MTGTIVVSVLCLAGLAFMGYFFVALCKERNTGTRHPAQLVTQSWYTLHESRSESSVQSEPAISGQAYVGSEEA